MADEAAMSPPLEKLPGHKQSSKHNQGRRRKRTRNRPNASRTDSHAPATTKGETSLSPLLALPAEIRNLIYRYTFTTLDSDDPAKPGTRAPALLQPLLTCRKIYEEAGVLAFSLVTFAFALDNVEYSEFQNRVPRLRSEKIQAIRSIERSTSLFGYPCQNMRLGSMFLMWPGDLGIMLEELMLRPAWERSVDPSLVSRGDEISGSQQAYFEELAWCIMAALWHWATLKRIKVYCGRLLFENDIALLHHFVRVECHEPSFQFHSARIVDAATTQENFTDPYDAYDDWGKGWCSVDPKPRQWMLSHNDNKSGQKRSVEISFDVPESSAGVCSRPRPPVCAQSSESESSSSSKSGPSDSRSSNSIQASGSSSSESLTFPEESDENELSGDESDDTDGSNSCGEASSEVSPGCEGVNMDSENGAHISTQVVPGYHVDKESCEAVGKRKRASTSDSINAPSKKQRADVFCSMLLALPGEIRNLIYCYVFSPSDTDDLFALESEATHLLEPLLTCRAIYEEAHLLAFSRVIHAVEFNEMQYLEEWSSCLRPEQRRAIRSMAILKTDTVDGEDHTWLGDLGCFRPDKYGIELEELILGETYDIKRVRPLVNDEDVETFGDFDQASLTELAVALLVILRGLSSLKRIKIHCEGLLFERDIIAVFVELESEFKSRRFQEWDSGTLPEFQEADHIDWACSWRISSPDPRHWKLRLFDDITKQEQYIDIHFIVSADWAGKRSRSPWSDDSPDPDSFSIDSTDDEDFEFYPPGSLYATDWSEDEDDMEWYGDTFSSINDAPGRNCPVQ